MMRIYAFKNLCQCDFLHLKGSADLIFLESCSASLHFTSTMRHSHAKADNPLKESGLKSTPGRRAVLQVLEKASSPLSPEQIHAKVGSEVCDRATVYRILDSLSQASLAQRITLEGKTLYLPEESSHHHHHIICRKCRSTVCLDECLISPLEKKAHQLGCLDIHHSLQLTGLCSKCSS